MDHSTRVAALLIVLSAIVLVGCPDPVAPTDTGYQIFYDANGGSNPPSDDSGPYDEGELARVLGMGSMSRAGHVFVGWTTDVSATLNVIRPGDVVALGSSDRTLYARWVRVNTVAVDPASFPTGTDDAGSASVATAYEIQDTEVTLELVATILQWAFENGKLNSLELSKAVGNGIAVSLNNATLLSIPHGSVSVDADGAYSVTLPTSEFHYPAGNISIYGAFVLANWLTEMTLGAAHVVYDISDISDDVTSSITADLSQVGYRVPTVDEWELAARWLGNDDLGGAAVEEPGGSEQYWTPGEYASGANAAVSDLAATEAVAWYLENSDTTPNSGYYTDGVVYGSHPVGTAGNADGDGTPLTGAANALGLYDMSGNAIEWAVRSDFDGASTYGYGEVTYIMGGSWAPTGIGTFNNSDNGSGVATVRIGARYETAGYLDGTSTGDGVDMGFRFVRTVP